MQTIKDECCWQLGNGNQIHLWNDVWLDKSVLDMLQIPGSVQKTLKARVADFISDKCWSVQATLASKFPELVSAINEITFLTVIQMIS